LLAKGQLGNAATSPRSVPRSDSPQGSKLSCGENAQQHPTSHTAKVLSLSKAQGATGSLPRFSAPTWTVRHYFLSSGKSLLLES